MFAQDYRPKKFSEVAGQETAVATLKSIAMTDKFPVRALLLQGAYGTGKCVPAGTRVITQKGYQPIETLFEDPEEGFNDADFTVNTRQGKAKATKFYYEKLAEVLTVTTKNGRTIRGTAKHRVMAEYAENIQDEIVEVASPSVAALRMARSVGTTFTLPSISEPIRIKEFGQAWPIEGITHNLSVNESMTIGSSEQVRLLDPHLKQDLFPLGLMNKGFTVLFSTTPQEFGEHKPSEAWTCGAIMGTGGRHHSGPEYYFMGTKEMCQTFAIKAGWHGPLVHTLKWSGTYHYGISPSKDDIVDVQLPYAFEGEVVPATMNWDIESRWEFLEGLRFSGVLKVIAGKFLINTRSKLVADTVFEVLTTLGRPPIRYELDSNSGKIYIVEADRVAEVPSISVSLSGFEPNHSPYNEEYLRDEVETITTINESVYDLTVPGVEEFYAQGTYNHNTTLSRLFAKAVNCEQFKRTGEVCNECAGCLEAERPGSLTYREYDATRVGNVDAIKSLLDSLQIKNFEGRRVITVDEIHASSKQAQSALLKVLEEGVPDTIFVFATTDAVIKTIESRSVKLDFFPLPKDVIIKRLKEVVAIEGIGITEDQLNAIAFKSQGHMRNALSVLEHFSIAGDEAIRTPQSDVKQYFLNCLKKQPTDDVILRIMQYPLLDVQAAIRDFIVNCFKVTEGLEGRIRQKGLSFQIFKYFYTPEAQQAFHDEVGMEILLRAFAEQLSR